MTVSTNAETPNMNEQEYEQAVERIGEIINAEPCTPEYDELVRLTDEVEAYEDEHWGIGEENMNYIENPKTKGSGIICCIPQTGECPNKCEDCFFQSGRSYLEPLDKNLPNIPPPSEYLSRIVRVNDGNDSNVDRENVMATAKRFPMKFYNTALDEDLGGFDAPVVLTLNPGPMTDKDIYWLDLIPKNLMFVRFRANTWNVDLCDKAVDYYSERKVPIILTFMAYFKTFLPQIAGNYYTFRKRTLNSYWAITTVAWESYMARYKYNKWVYSCGKIEGEKGTTACRHCGNCLREYFATMERFYTKRLS